MERIKNTEVIEDFLQELTVGGEPKRIFTFLRRAGHKVDGYIAQEINLYPGKYLIIYFVHAGNCNINCNAPHPSSPSSYYILLIIVFS